MSGLQIRDARASDRDAIEAVTLSAFQEYAASKSNRWEDYRQNILAALAAVQPATQIVAELLWKRRIRDCRRGVSRFIAAASRPKRLGLGNAERKPVEQCRKKISKWPRRK